MILLYLICKRTNKISNRSKTSSNDIFRVGVAPCCEKIYHNLLTLAGVNVLVAVINMRDKKYCIKNNPQQLNLLFHTA